MTGQEVFSVIAVAISVTSVIITATFAYLNRRTAQGATLGEFLFQIDRRLDDFKSVHISLRPGGHWADVEAIKAEDWPEIDAYMGVFERIYALMVRGLIDLETVRKLYRYRLINIVNNRAIRTTRLCGTEGAYWENLIKLCKRLEVDIPCEGDSTQN